MDINRKLELAKQQIAMITRADDEDAAVMKAAVGEVVKFIEKEVVEAEARREAAIAERVAAVSGK